MSGIKTFNEPVTARRLTRLRFLEQESDHLRTIKSDLEYCLINSKQVLNEVLSTNILSSRQHLDRSADTEVSSHVSLGQFEATVAKNIELYTLLGKYRQERNITLGKALISEQICEESVRKENEFMNEMDDQINDLKYLLDKKDNRIKTLNTQLKALEEKFSEIKNENAVILPLSESSLGYHRQIEKIKFNLSHVSKQMQKAEMQREELIENSKKLETMLEKYKLLIKNPLVRIRRSGNYNAEMSYDAGFYNNSDSSNSSEEVTFPDKFQIESKHKPELPKLDFSKISKKALTEAQSPADLSQNKIKSKIKDLEDACKDKTEYLSTLRQKVLEQRQKNQKIIDSLSKKQEFKILSNAESNFEEKKSKRKRPMSDALDYIIDPANEETKHVSAKEEPYEELFQTDNYEQEKSDSEVLDSFNGSEVEKYEEDIEEPDSILADYMNDIIR
ncbi:unnamed protein product [Blepharisma stoltei]|uniref:Uncharacterized protein n=1 Tax=Blepharisma stoltei TaxID=1481888 RepID=A0AAU9KBT4_9CILI|nr:unnamed protein product [Blepharisma stoltei]